MLFDREAEARYNHPEVVGAINSLASSVKALSVLYSSSYHGDGKSLTEDLDCLVTILMNQIVSCVPREKQHSILISHGLQEYIDDLDESWENYCLFAERNIENG